MARPQKNNADYFPHDADMRNDPKIKALRRKFKHTGYAVWNYILESLADSDFFEIEWSDLNIELLAADFDIEPDELREIVAYSSMLGLLQTDNGILTCEKLKLRFKPLLAKRKPNSNEFPNQKPMKNDVSDIENPQSKVKESKVKNSKVNTTLEVDTTPVDNSDDGSVDGLDFDNNLIPKQEAVVSVMPVAEEVDCFWDVFKTVYPRKRGISVPMAKDALRKFLEYGGDQADLIAAAVKYGRIVAESKTEEQFMKTPHVFAGGYFKTFVPKYRRNCPACHGEGFVEGPDGNMVECCCVDRYKEWKA